MFAGNLPSYEHMHDVYNSKLGFDMWFQVDMLTFKCYG